MTFTSIACPHCNQWHGKTLPNGQKPRSIWELRFNYDTEKDEAVCMNCGYRRPYHKRKGNKAVMTQAQLDQVEYIRDFLIRKATEYGSDREYKRFEFQLLETGTVSLIAEIGSPNDEGTLAGVFCRETRHLFIGRRGGLTLVNAGKFVHDDEGHTKKVSRAGHVTGWEALTHVTWY